MRRLIHMFKYLDKKSQIIIYLLALLNGISIGLTATAIMRNGIIIINIFPLILNIYNTVSIIKIIKREYKFKIDKEIYELVYLMELIEKKKMLNKNI